MEGRLRSIRLSAVVVLFLCTLTSRVDAQEFTCWPIAPGDTASSLARRLTGKSADAYGLSFQIRDPKRRMFVPKSHYQRLQLDWQVCISSGPIPKNQVLRAPVVQLATWAVAPGKGKEVAPPPPALRSEQLPLARADLTLGSVPFVATIGGAVLLIVLFAVMGAALAPRPMPPSARLAGENFVNAFAWPLIDASSNVPPIQTRLRFVRRKQELEIAIAPGPGHRYPNLADHKKNVEYDVDRVMRGVKRYGLSKPPRAKGKWVVVTLSPIDGKEQGTT